MRDLLLAIDTATEVVAVGIATLERGQLDVVLTLDEVAPRRANAELLSQVGRALDEAGVTIQAVSSVLAGRGPGSFTGVRIGVATAKGIAHGLGVPLWGVGTLDAIAWRVAQHHDGLIGIVGDAMRGEVYPSLFRAVRTDTGVRVTRISPDTVAKPEAAAARFAEQIGDDAVVLAGNGLAKYLETFTSVLGERMTTADAQLWGPTGEGLFGAWIGAARTGALVGGDPASLLPIYTRLSDAEENERARSGHSVEPPPPTGVAGGEAGR